MASRYFQACCIITSCLVSGQPLTYGLLGQTVTLKPDVPTQPDKILWKHNRSKLLEFDGMEQQVNDRFHDRVTLDWLSAELTITDLRYEDSGEYELKTAINKMLHRSLYKLEVIGKVAKPTISCDVNNGNSTVYGTKATLMCSADPTHPHSLMKFDWGSGGNVQPGPELTISLEDKQDDRKYTCRVSNPLTNETTTFTAKDCFSEESSSVALAASLTTTILIGLLLLVVLSVVFCKRKSIACFAKTNKEDLEKQLPADVTEESYKETPEDDERRPFFERAATLPSPQRLDQLAQGNGNMKPRLSVSSHKVDTTLDLDEGEGLEKSTDEEERTVSPPSLLGRKPSFCEGQDNLPSNNKEDADADESRGHAGHEEKFQEFDCSNSEEANEPDPAGVFRCSRDTESDLEPAASPDQPGLETTPSELGSASGETLTRRQT